MSKKVISILLSVAMLVAVLCVGFGAVTASADETVTYYFCAPDSYLATNNSVGYYYWQPSENAPWPGQEATPAPEVGKNVYKIEIGDMDTTGTVIFNAFVDAGTPADPELAKNAHQTVNILLEGYEAGQNALYPDGLEDFYGMIYVLYDDDAHRTPNELSGAMTTSGEWFSIDPAASNYYANSDAYKTYDFVQAGGNDDTDAEPVATGSKYHEGDKVTVDVKLGGIDAVSAFNTNVTFDPAVLAYTGNNGSGMIMANKTADDTIKVGAMFDPTNGSSDYAGAAASVIKLTFDVTKDTDDLGIAFKTTTLSHIVDGVNTKVIAKGIEVEDVWTSIDVTVECPHGSESVVSDSDSEEPITPVASDSDSEKPIVEPEHSDSEKGSDSAVDTSSVVDSTVDSSSAVDSASDSAKDSSASSDDKETKDSASKKGTDTSKSSSTGNNGSTVATAGTFAVVSLVVILMAAAAVVLYTRKKTEE